MIAYSSNNKYSLLGAFRNFARMIGYEVPLGICVVSVAIMAGSLNIVDIAQLKVHCGSLSCSPWVHSVLYSSHG
jgi:NADH:ubiquinone oxidoreductase subunit H